MSIPARPTCVYFEGLVQTARLALPAMQSNNNDSPLPRLLQLGGSNSDFQSKPAEFSSLLVNALDVLSCRPRGPGRSNGPMGNGSMEDYARDALALLGKAATVSFRRHTPAQKTPLIDGVPTQRKNYHVGKI